MIFSPERAAKKNIRIICLGVVFSIVMCRCVVMCRWFSLVLLVLSVTWRVLEQMLS